MNSKVSFFAAVSESFCHLCVFWIVATTMVLSRQDWSMGILWPLAWSLLSAVVGVFLLKKQRGFTFLMLLGTGLAAVGLAFFLAVSHGRVTVLQVLTLAVGAGMASGLPVYYLVHEPRLSRHLNALDLLLLAFVWLLLMNAGRDFAPGTGLLITAVLLMNAAAAVGLRMNADGSVQGSWRAVLTALVSAVCVAALVALLIAVFSRSGAVTGGVLGAIREAFRWIGRLIRSFFEWLAAMFYRPPTYEEVVLDFEMPSVAGVDETMHVGKQSMAWLGVVAGAAVLAVLAALLIVLRKEKWSLSQDGRTALPAAKTVRMSGGLQRRWREFLAALRFRWTTLMRRNSPPGVFAALERQAKRRRRPRREDESPRAFIARMAPDGTLAALADDLDRHFYGKEPYRLSAAECRALRKTF